VVGGSQLNMADRAGFSGCDYTSALRALITAAARADRRPQFGIADKEGVSRSSGGECVADV